MIRDLIFYTPKIPNFKISENNFDISFVTICAIIMQLLRKFFHVQQFSIFN